MSNYTFPNSIQPTPVSSPIPSGASPQNPLPAHLIPPQNASFSQRLPYAFEHSANMKPTLPQFPPISSNNAARFRGNDFDPIPIALEGNLTSLQNIPESLLMRMMPAPRNGGNLGGGESWSFLPINANSQQSAQILKGLRGAGLVSNSGPGGMSNEVHRQVQEPGSCAEGASRSIGDDRFQDLSGWGVQPSGRNSLHIVGLDPLPAGGLESAWKVPGNRSLGHSMHISAPPDLFSLERLKREVLDLPSFHRSSGIGGPIPGAGNFRSQIPSDLQPTALNLTALETLPLEASEPPIGPVVPLLVDRFKPFRIIDDRSQPEVAHRHDTQSEIAGPGGGGGGRDLKSDLKCDLKCEEKTFLSSSPPPSPAMPSVDNGEAGKIFSNPGEGPSSKAGEKRRKVAAEADAKVKGTTGLTSLMTTKGKKGEGTRTPGKKRGANAMAEMTLGRQGTSKSGSKLKAVAKPEGPGSMEDCAYGEVLISVPTDLFKLSGLHKILNLQTWNEHLDNDEREFLRQFLPSGISEGPGGGLDQLLDGQSNFHFGNPMQHLWELMVNSECHPRVVKNREGLRCVRHAEHFHLVREYHNRMVGDLMEIARIFAQKPDADISQKLEHWKNVMAHKAHGRNIGQGSVEKTKRKRRKAMTEQSPRRKS